MRNDEARAILRYVVACVQWGWASSPRFVSTRRFTRDAVPAPAGLLLNMFRQVTESWLFNERRPPHCSHDNWPQRLASRVEDAGGGSRSDRVHRPPDANQVATDDRVSRRHALIRFRERTLGCGLRQRNGTYLNDQRIIRPIACATGSHQVWPRPFAFHQPQFMPRDSSKTVLADRTANHPVGQVLSWPTSSAPLVKQRSPR